jgi:hypothetical protein
VFVHLPGRIWTRTTRRSRCSPSFLKNRRQPPPKTRSTC